MKILHVVPTYIPAWRYGGTIRSVHGLCRALAARGHEVDVFTTNVDGSADSNVALGRPIDMDGVRVWYHPSHIGRRLYWSPKMGHRLKSHIGEYSVAHLHSVFLWPTTAAAGCARRARIPYIISPRGMMVKELFRRKSGLLKVAWTTCFEKRNLEGAAAIHVTSELEAADIRAFRLRLPRIVVVPNGTDIPVPGVAVRIATERPFVLFMGRLNWKKGIDRLILAMRDVPGTDLVLAGNDEEGYREQLERIAQDAGVSMRIRYAGQVSGEQKADLLRSAAVLALPSHSENFGNVVLEAMAEGCPVVISPQVGLAQTVRETGCGEVSDSEPQTLARTLSHLLADPEGRRRMGEAGRRTAKERFSWDKIAEQMEREYRELVLKK